MNVRLPPPPDPPRHPQTANPRGKRAVYLGVGQGRRWQLWMLQLQVPRLHASAPPGPCALQGGHPRSGVLMRCAGCLQDVLAVTKQEKHKMEDGCITATLTEGITDWPWLSINYTICKVLDVDGIGIREWPCLLRLYACVLAPQH